MSTRQNRHYWMVTQVWMLPEEKGLPIYDGFLLHGVRLSSIRGLPILATDIAL